MRAAWGSAALLAAVLATPARSKVLLTVEEALALVFPGCELARETVFLTEAEIESAAELAGEPPASALVVRHVAMREGRVVGTAYLDTHSVRTLEETVLVVVQPDGTVGRIEVLSFDEPPDYMPREGWYRQFDGKALDADLNLDRGIRAVTGATLTARATTACTRRVLAIHGVIQRRGEVR